MVKSDHNGDQVASNGSVLAEVANAIANIEHKGEDAKPKSFNGFSRRDAVVTAALIESSEALRSAVVKLQTAIDECEPLADDSGSLILESSERVRQVVEYAHRLAYTSFAPPGFIPGRTQLRHFKPPAPQDLQFRASQLHKIEQEWQERHLKSKLARLHVPQTLPVEKLAARPSKMQVLERKDVLEPPTLMKDLPPMPPGWKPGDPIPGLPPIPPYVEKPPTKPQPLSAAFDFALNPEMDIQFGVSDSEEESSDDSF